MKSGNAARQYRGIIEPKAATKCVAGLTAMIPRSCRVYRAPSRALSPATAAGYFTPFATPAAIRPGCVRSSLRI